MNVLIIEDEYPSAIRLQKMIEEIDPEVKILGIFDSVSSSINYINSNSKIDLLFLDIHLSDGNGLNILKSISRNIPTIITTAYDQYALEAFNFLSIAYLLKPIKKVELENSIAKFESLLKLETNSNSEVNSNSYTDLNKLINPKKYCELVIGKIGKAYYPISVSDISYFYVEEGDSWIKTDSGSEYLLPGPLDKMETQLNPKHFFRVNRKFICSKKSIFKFKISTKSKILVDLKPSNSIELIVSSEKSAAFKAWLIA